MDQELIFHNETAVALAYKYFEGNKGDNCVYEVYDMYKFKKWAQDTHDKRVKNGLCALKSSHVVPLNALPEHTKKTLHFEKNENLYVIYMKCKNNTVNDIIEDSHLYQYWDRCYYPMYCC